MKRTEIKVKIIAPTGEPYKGAIIKMRLEKPFFYAGVYINNNEYREYTNTFGVAEFELVPSVYDESGENFYNVEIVYDTVLLKKVVVPESDTVLSLDALDEYQFPYERIDFINECDTRL